MPSLPTLPTFENSDNEATETTSDDEGNRETDLGDSDFNPIESTPAPSAGASTIRRVPGSSSSTVRFARSIASRSSRSTSTLLESKSSVRSRGHDFTFDDVSSILPRDATHQENPGTDLDIGLPRDEEEEDLSLGDALESLSRSSSPFQPGDVESLKPSKKYDNSVGSLRSEPRVRICLSSVP